MYGMKRGNIEFGVVMVPDRIKPLLTVQIDNRSYKVGQFNDMQTAEEFFDILNYVCFGNNEERAREIFDTYVK